jgi:hypothetical protein
MTWLEALLVQNLWLTLLVWSALYAFDYVQTIRGARLYGQVGKQHIIIEGSYEMTPYFQADIDRLRPISPRFLLMVLLGLAGIVLVYWLTQAVGLPQLFALLAGGLILRLLVVHIQHIRNIASYRYVERHPDHIRGQIEYARPLLLSARATEYSLFAALYGVLFALTSSWFVLGGALGSLAIATSIWRWRRKLVSSADKSMPAASTADSPSPDAR